MCSQAKFVSGVCQITSEKCLSIKEAHVLYYWHILHSDETELLNKFYSAQLLRPTKNDWVQQITKDKKDLNINLSDEEVKLMSKPKLKN